MTHPIPDNHVIQPGQSTYFQNDDISSLDGGRYEFNSPLPAHERTTIRDRSGRKIEENEETPQSGQGRNVLAALDFSRQEHVTAVIEQTIKSTNAQDTVILFNVLSETGGTADGARSRADSRVQEIAELAKRIDGAARVLTHVVHGKPEATLLGVAAKHNVDLIILGKRKLKGLKKLTATSVSNHVIEQSNCSVLIAK